MGIFKAYDIRGLVPSELDTAMARRIGRALADMLGAESGAKRLLVGRDMRTHSPEIAGAVVEGIRDAGCDVVDIGLASTPMVYFAIGSRDVDGGLVVTASHNPGEYNGMKLCRRGSVPISGATGIAELERLCGEGDKPAVAQRGGLEQRELLADYVEHVASFADMGREVRIAIDAANGISAYTLPQILERLTQVEAQTLFMELDGTFPNHEANPLKEENLDPVRELVRSSGARLGVSFDGDADRCCFVDESGATVSADLMTALLAQEFLRKEPGAKVVYDLRSSWVVKQVIAEAGGVPVRDRVGHSFIKKTMRDNGAIFGGELSGHFYFRDNFVCDSGVIAMVSALNLISRSERPLSELVAGLRRYHATGEINFRYGSPEEMAAMIETLRERYSSGRQDELDGITVEFGDLAAQDWWWFNVRMSNTEPLLRLNLEARSAELRDARRDELVAAMGTPVS